MLNAIHEHLVEKGYKYMAADAEMTIAAAMLETNRIDAALEYIEN